MKYKSVERIEELKFEISIKRSGDGWIDINLLEKGEQVGVTKCRSNAESLDKIKARISGEIPIQQGTYLSGALDNLAEKAEANRFAKGMYEYNKSFLGEYDEKIIDLILKRNGKYFDGIQSLKPAEPELFYLIHAISVRNLNGKPVHFTNEFVGTERDFNEYKNNYGKKPTMKADIVRVETFAPEFRATHREIEKIVFAYQNNTGDKSKMLNTLKSFDEEAIVRLEKRLKEEGINPKKFESDMKAEPHNKIKPKM